MTGEFDRYAAYALEVARIQPHAQKMMKKIIFDTNLGESTNITSCFEGGNAEWQHNLRIVYASSPTSLPNEAFAVDNFNKAATVFHRHSGQDLRLVKTKEQWEYNPPSLRLIVQNLQRAKDGAALGNPGTRNLNTKSNAVDLGVFAAAVDEDLDQLYHGGSVSAEALEHLRQFVRRLAAAARESVPSNVAVPPGAIPGLRLRCVWYEFRSHLFTLLRDSRADFTTDRPMTLLIANNVAERCLCLPVPRCATVKGKNHCVVEFATRDDRKKVLNPERPYAAHVDAMVVLRSLGNFDGGFLVDQADTEKERHGFKVDATSVGKVRDELARVLHQLAKKEEAAITFVSSVEERYQRLEELLKAGPTSSKASSPKASNASPRASASPHKLATGAPQRDANTNRFAALQKR